MLLTSLFLVMLLVGCAALQIIDADQAMTGAANRLREKRGRGGGGVLAPSPEVGWGVLAPSLLRKDQPELTSASTSALRTLKKKP